MRLIIKISFIWLLFCCSTNSYCQSYFVKGFSNGGIVDLYENSDSTICLVGLAKDTNYGSTSGDWGTVGALFSRVDRFGNLLSRRVYGSLRNDLAGHIFPLIESGNVINYLITGQSMSFSPLYPNNYNQAYLLKVNSNGDTLWTRALDYGGYPEYQDAIVSTDSNYVFCGANGAATLTKVNRYDGDTVWVRQYKQAITTSIAATGVNMASDSGFYISGSAIPPGNNNDYFMLLKTDSAGMLQWGKAYGTNVRPLQCWDMVGLTTGELLLVGQTDINAQSDIGVIKLNAAGDTVWCHKYSFPFNQYDIGYSAIEDNDGNYVILGMVNDANSNYAGELLKIDTTGNVMWAWKYNWNGNSLSTIKKAYDGGYWIACVSVIKLDSTGYGCTAISQTVTKKSFPLNVVAINPQMAGGAVACKRTPTMEFPDTVTINDLCLYLGVDDLFQTATELKVYPNPAESQITISNLQSAKGNVTVTIYDVLGKEKMQGSFTTVSEGKIQVDVSTLDSGIYFVKVNDSVQKFVKM